MFWAIAFLLGGMVCGRMFSRLFRAWSFGPITFIAILVLLFIMGAQIGGDGQLFQNFFHLGARAFIITLGAVGGSLGLCAFLMNRYFAARKSNPEKKDAG